MADRVSDAGKGGNGRPDRGRRRILKRLGLAATAIYAAPLLVGLSRAGASSASFSFSGSSRPRRRVRAAAPPPPPPPEILVTAASAEEIDRITAGGYTLLARDSLDVLSLEMARFSLPAGRTVEEARAEIGALVPGSLFDVNTLYRPGEFLCGEDSCAAFDMIGWQLAAHACPAGTTVGLVDTPINREHPALAEVDIDAFPVLAEGRSPAGAVHGTSVAILLAGRSDSRTPGLLSGATILAAEAFHRDAAGADAADAFDVARALDTLVERGARVVNLSFSGGANLVLQRVVEAAAARGVIMVAAAGNDGPNAEPLFPAAFEDVVAVTAVDRSRAVWRNAAAGPHIDFAAPGVSLWTAASVSGGRLRSGTSYAAPFVAAALAVARARDPEAEPRQLVEALAADAVDLGEPGRDGAFGWGLVQSQSCAPSGDSEALLRPAGG